MDEKCVKWKQGGAETDNTHKYMSLKTDQKAVRGTESILVFSTYALVTGKLTVQLHYLKYNVITIILHIKDALLQHPFIFS